MAESGEVRDAWCEDWESEREESREGNEVEEEEITGLENSPFTQQ